MAYSESQPTVSLTAETTFAGTDLHKFVELNSAGRVVVGGTATTSAIPIGTLLSATYSTSTGANETVTVCSDPEVVFAILVESHHNARLPFGYGKHL